MKAIAWVVEINYVGDKWIAEDCYTCRKSARWKAQDMRASGWRVRVRQYVRVEEGK